MNEESTQMQDAGFVFDPTHQGYARWTHLEKVITCLRSPYMTDDQWEDHKRQKIEDAKAALSV